jgi:hypothetical protein
MKDTVQLAKRIIEEQELVIGPLAWREAKKVSGLQIGSDHEIKFKGEIRAVLEELVRQYEGLFGPASVEVCREAVKTLLPSMPEKDVPDVLR